MEGKFIELLNKPGAKSGGAPIPHFLCNILANGNYALIQP